MEWDAGRVKMEGEGVKEASTKLFNCCYCCNKNQTNPALVRIPIGKWVAIEKATDQHLFFTKPTTGAT